MPDPKQPVGRQGEDIAVNHLPTAIENDSITLKLRSSIPDFFHIDSHRSHQAKEYTITIQPVDFYFKLGTTIA
jgi:hypothetical protein